MYKTDESSTPTAPNRMKLHTKVVSNIDNTIEILSPDTSCILQTQVFVESEGDNDDITVENILLIPGGSFNA